MNEKPLVSLIVPFYNIAHLCDRFFESLMRQTYTNIQLILVNDGSTDDIETKLFSYKDALEEKGYLFEYYNQENKGLGGAINTGLKKITGEFICWADPDDYFEDNAFEVRVKHFNDHSECMILTCDANIRNASDLSVVVSKESRGFVHHHERKQFQYLLDYESLFCSGCHMIRTSAFRKVNPAMDIYEAKRGQNWQLLLPMYYYFNRDSSPEVVYNHVVYRDSMSHSDVDFEAKHRRIEDNEKILSETLKRIKMPEEERETYLRHIETFHIKLKMYNARTFNKKHEYAVYYSQLKQQKEIDFKDRLRRLRFLLTGR